MATPTSTTDEPEIQRVLVVEDDPASLTYLTLALTRQGYLVASAESAAEARDQLSPARIQTFDCVITDYRMPESSGLDLLAWIQEREPELATIIVTAEGAKDLVTASLRGGAVDFLEKPVVVRKLQPAVARAVEHTRRQRRLTGSERAIQEVGRAQEWMIGAEAASGRARTRVAFHPKHAAGGDFFSHFRPGPGQLLCLLTDVSGHDVRAAYHSAYFQGIVRGMLERAAPLAEIFATFNRFLLEKEALRGRHDTEAAELPVSLAATALLIDSAGRVATIHSHGAPAPVYWRADGAANIAGANGGMPLGWFADFASPGVAQPIAEDGAFTLWTDGLEEVAERLEVSALSLACAVQQARERGEKLPQLESALDDVLLADIELAPAENDARRFRPLILEAWHGGQAGEIDTLQARWERSLRLAVPRLPEAMLHDILLASREAVLNALLHGCDRSPAAQAGFQAAYCAAAQTIRVRIDDPGPGHAFDVARHEARAAHELVEQHHGLILMKHLASRLEVARQGASITMDFSWQ